MATLIRLWKPHGVLSQFTDADNRPTLKTLVKMKDVYPVGRLDRDSEGLLLLTDSGTLQATISRPGSGFPKTYQVLVEGVPDAAAIEQLVSGIELRDGPARALSARMIETPELPARTVHPRAGRKCCWLEIDLDEGRNRQVRRMCAAIGVPVLRLVRTRIGPWTLAGLGPGSSRSETLHAPVSDPRRSSSSPRPHNRQRGTRPNAHHQGKPRASRTPRGS